MGTPYCNYTLPNGLTLPYLRFGVDLSGSDYDNTWMVVSVSNGSDLISINYTTTIIAAIQVMNTTLDPSSMEPVGATATECILQA